MGMYTELHFNNKLKKKLNQNIIDILEYMLDNNKNKPILPKHEFFKCKRWNMLFLSDSYYFDADTNSTLRFDNISNSYYLCIRSNIKNYDNEIEKFIDWIMPYLAKSEGDFLGFYRYEMTEKPTLIYADVRVNETNKKLYTTDEAKRSYQFSLAIVVKSFLWKLLRKHEYYYKSEKEIK